MKRSTIRTLLLLCVILDLVLVGVVVYDYYENDSDWIVYALGVFAVFVLITAILFAMATLASRQVVVKEVIREVPVDSVRFDNVSPGVAPIPRAPVNAPPIRAPLPARAPVRAEPEGPFRYNGYTLHTREVELANAGGKRRIYFFSKKKPKSGRPCAKPAGYHVGVNERTGLPFLKKGSGKDGEDLTPAAAEPGYRPQCSALTEEGKQCRNSAREGSKYCASHFGYQPPVMSKAEVNKDDTKARVKDAPDTKPSTRKSWFGRLKRSSA